MRSGKAALCAATVAGLVSAGAATAQATVLDFNFGSLLPSVGGQDSVEANGTTVPFANQVLGQNPQIYQLDGIQVSLQVYYTLNSANNGTTGKTGEFPGYPTSKYQKGGEIGAGASTTNPKASDTDLEIVPNVYLMVDNSIIKNSELKIDTINFESQQIDKNFNGTGYSLYEDTRYGYYNASLPTSTYVNGDLGSTDFDPSKIVWLGVSGATSNAVNSAQVANVYDDLVFTADPMFSNDGGKTFIDLATYDAEFPTKTSGCGGSLFANGYATCNTLIHESVYAAAPELSTWAMLGFGFAGLGLAGYRKARGRAAIAD